MIIEFKIEMISVFFKAGLLLFGRTYTIQRIMSILYIQKNPWLLSDLNKAKFCR